ncbi:MAG: hypothetical protein HN849_04970 [Victivallales bacterium]|nr:hypothetical protein [Victivallales bacterium]
MRRTHISRIGSALCMIAWGVLAAPDGPNMLKNGDLAARGEDGLPSQWGVHFEGEGVEGTTSLVAGPDGRPAIKIECTKFPTKSNRAWVIFKQDGMVKTKGGQKLFMSFWLKKEKMKSDNVTMAVMRIKPWGTVVRADLPVTEAWQETQLIVQPSAVGGDCDSTRFEIYFMETGTLYLSDLRVAETSKSMIVVNPIRQQMVRETTLATEKNIIRNSSFEAGTSGWGTSSFDYGLVKADRTAAHHGRSSGLVELNREALPSGYKDYPKAAKIDFKTVRTVTKGWLRFEEGQTYTLSVFLKSDKPGREAKIEVYFMTGESKAKAVSVGDAWQRQILTFEAPDIFGFVGVSAATEDGPAKLWIDGVQLERGAQATAYASRYPVELALRTKRPAGVHYTGEQVVLELDSWSRGPGNRAEVELSVTDFRGKEVHRETLALTGDAAPATWRVPVTGNGHYVVSAAVKGEGFAYRMELPFVIIYPYAKTHGNRDARFGTNHPYYTDLLQTMAQDAGVFWVRDWTLKWDNVEPEKGVWDFSGPDLFFGRARRLNLRVQAILPDPSASWASSGPPEARGKRLGDAYEDLWHLPKDMADYRRYARECITRYRDVTTAWEVLNEPFAHKCRNWLVGEKYEQFLTAVKEEAAKVDPALKIMRCGLHYLDKTEEPNARAARLADILSEHVYPRYHNTLTFLGHAKRITDFQAAHNAKKDIWFTEYGMYSNDRPSVMYGMSSNYLTYGDERTAAAYNLKYLAILFSHGTSKVFFHQRTWPLGLNKRSHRIHFEMLFDYGPTPHKFFVATNAMAWLLPPGTKPGVPVTETGPLFAYGFERPNDRALLAWTDGAEVALSRDLLERMQGVAAYDMMGGRLDQLAAFGDDPVYLIGSPARIKALEKLLQP